MPLPITAIIGHDIKPIHGVDDFIGLGGRVPINDAFRCYPAKHCGGQQHILLLQLRAQVDHQILVLLLAGAVVSRMLPIDIDAVESVLLGHRDNGVTELLDLLRRIRRGHKGDFQRNVII